MGETISRGVQPELLAVFKGISGSENNIPELAQNRKSTDCAFLILLVITIILLMPFLVYTIIHSDLDRLVYGHDKCGNVCGKKNHYYDDHECSGKDFTSETLIQYDSDIVSGKNGELMTPRRCVKECDTGYKRKIWKCVKVDPENSTQNVSTLKMEEDQKHPIEYYKDNGWKIIVACFLSLVVAVVMFYLFKTVTAVCVWVSQLVVFISAGVYIGWMWYAYSTHEQKLTTKGKNILLLFSILATCTWLFLIFAYLMIFKHVRFVIALLKEAVKVTKDMPLLTIIPLLTFFVELIPMFSLFWISYYISSFGILNNLEDDYLYYESNAISYFTITFNAFVACWVIQFVFGIQHMIIAGAVAKWYFSRDKNNLNSPIRKSTSVVFKFHLGSIALGSPFMLIFDLIGVLFMLITGCKIGRACIDYCMSKIDSFFRIWSKNCYLLTAMHGQPFYKSGIRAEKMISSNVLDIIGIQIISSYAIAAVQALIIVLSLLLTGALLQQNIDLETWPIYITVIIVSTIAAVTTFSVYETTIGTIFLCFNEDRLLNDGIARPYAMSADFSEFVEKWKTVFGED